MTDWCILRCSNCKTLELAASLNDAGFEAWTPVTREVRRPTAQRSREEVAVPMMAGYVFAHADRLPELRAQSHNPAQQFRVWDSRLKRIVAMGHPFFHVFLGGEHRLISDAELEPLRRLERKPRPQRIERTFTLGERVRTDDGGFEGLDGIVVEVRAKTVVVSFGRGWLKPEIPTWAVRPVDEPATVHVNDVQPERDAA